MNLPGLIINGPLIADDQLHRVPTESKPRKKNGWYIAYDGGNTVIYGNWEEGDGHNIIKSNGSTKLDALDRSRIEALRTLREQEQLAAADEALELYESSKRDGFSEYLKVKKLNANSARFDGTTLIIPLQDSNGKVWSVQRIYADGSKYFLPGGRTRGCYHLITSGDIKNTDRVIICEGWATGASIHEATSLPVIVAFNAGNLKPVADSLGFSNLVIAADNDIPDPKSKFYPLGVGEGAAKDSGYPYILPNNIDEDFSDVFSRDPEEVKNYFIEKPETTGSLPIAHGLVGEIADWITSTSIKPQPLLSLAASLAFVGMLKGHRVKGYTDLRTNLLVISMAPTAGGKEHPQGCLRRLAKACDLHQHMMGEPVSGSGFLYGLQKAKNVGLLVMDEVGRYLGNLSGSGAGVHQKEIIDYIIKTFSCANSVLMGREKAKAAKEERIDIDQPHFCCYGSTVYEKFRDACGSGDIVDGFLNRWLMFHSHERPIRQQKVKFSDPPIALIEKIKAIAAISPYDSYGNPHPRELRFTPEAWDMFCTYRTLVDAMVDKAAYPMNQLYSRTCEHIEKVAHTLADDNFTGINDVRAAINIVEHSNRDIALFATMISDNVHEKDFVRVREIIKEAREIPHSALLRRCQFVTGGARRVNEMLEVMMGEDFIAVREGPNKKKIYKWIVSFK